MDSMSTFDTSVIKEALLASHFSQEMKVKLTSILSLYGCRTCPAPQSLRSQICDIAKYELQLKPAAAYFAMSSGIPAREMDFW